MQTPTARGPDEKTGPHDATASPEASAMLMLSVIDCAPTPESRRERLGKLTAKWWTTGRYYAFLRSILGSTSLSEDAKLRLITMGRPGPQDARSFVLNQPLLAAEMILAVSAASCATAVNREQRLQCLGFTAGDVAAALMREAKATREPLLKRLAGIGD